MVRVIQGLIGTLYIVGLIAALQVPFSDSANARRVHVRHHHHHHYARHHYARRVARGVAVGTASYRYSCGNLAHRCNRGDAWACIKHDTQCW